MVVGSIPTPLTNVFKGLGVMHRVRSGNVRLRRATLRPTFALLVMLMAPAAQAQQIHVIDADTVEQDGTRWRLVGLDAPEIHRAHCPAERARGITAAARLIALLASDGGRLEPHGTRRDKYGRRLGRLLIGAAARDWATIAIAEGHAVAWNGKGPRPDWCAARVEGM